jgi:hypothetical protein
VEHVRPDVTVVDQELLTYAWYVRSWRRREPDLLPPFGTGAADRYSGDPGTENVNWIDHLIARRPVAFLGWKEESWGGRYQMLPSGYVLLATRRDETPAQESRADEAIAQLATFHVDEALSRHDAWSFEAAERARGGLRGPRRGTRCPAVEGRERHDRAGPGDTGVDHVAHGADAGSRARPAEAAAIVRMFYPSLRDSAFAATDLRRWLDTGVTGPQAEQARAWLETRTRR